MNYRKLNPSGSTPREISEVVNNLVDGKSNNTGVIELDSGGASETIIYNERIGYDSVIVLEPYSALSSSYGLPYGSFISTQNQTATNNTTAYTVTFNTSLSSEYISVVSNSRITVQYSGAYLILCGLQVSNSNTTLHRIDVWLRVNGVDVANSRKVYSIHGSHGGLNGSGVVFYKNFGNLNANDYVEIVYCVEDVNVFLQAIGTGTSPTRPATNSAKVTLIYQSSNGFSSGLYALPYISSTSKGQATLAHPPNTLTGRIYRYIIVA